MSIVRLDRMLSGQGFGTRSEIREIVRRGAVKVNGATVKDPGIKVDPLSEAVTVNGAPVNYKEHLYVMLNKPQGVVSASRDPRQPTVLDLLPQALQRPGLFPAGRLDKDTEGLLIITDDGGFAHDILSPVKHVDKRYFLRLDSGITAGDAAALERGITLEDGTVCLPAKLETEGDEPWQQLHIVIREGKYHQVKRMFAAVGKTVVTLKRMSVGGLALDPALKPGEAREISGPELQNIKNKQVW